MILAEAAHKGAAEADRGTMTGYGIPAIIVLPAGTAMITVSIIFFVRREKFSRNGVWTQHPVRAGVWFIIPGLILTGLAAGELTVTG
ncbi:MAG: hypothetical protein LUD51_07495 [Clostridia bacterium]|nr:hypothetical protein [Clostridia bacterium]